MTWNEAFRKSIRKWKRRADPKIKHVLPCDDSCALCEVAAILRKEKLALANRLGLSTCHFCKAIDNNKGGCFSAYWEWLEGGETPKLAEKVLAHLVKCHKKYKKGLEVKRNAILC